jgi:predicted ATPase/DNA-binding SARP family transcriptional activator
MLRVRVCGGLVVEVDDRQVPQRLFGGRQGRLVLAYLILERHRSVSRDELAELLWAADLPESWGSSLSVVLSKLRRMLAEAGLDPAVALSSTTGSVQLHLPDGTWVDLEVAAGAVAAAEAAVRAGDAAAAARAGDEAAAIASRGFLSDDCDWVSVQRERLRDLQVRAVHAQAEAHLLAGHRGPAVNSAREALAVDELREASYRLLMRALAAAGERAEALRVWERCRIALAEELGVDPDSETEAVYLGLLGETAPSTLAAEPTVAPATFTVADPAPAALPTGVLTFLLTDIAQSTRLWEADPDAMTTALAGHDQLIARAVTANAGHLLKTRGEGDSTFSVFASVSHAAAAVIEIQQTITADTPDEGVALQVRASMHTGEAELRDGDYFGSAVNRAARLRAIAHGGQVLCSQATARVLEDRLPDGASLRGLGSHRLQDLARPEAVYQLCHPALAMNFPPLQSLEALPHNLPVQLTSFVGREQEIAQLTDLLRDQRLVTLTGAAGSGKTRLALQTSARVLTNYPDGVWLVELAGVLDSSAVVEAAASAMSVSQQPGETLVDAVLSFLRSKNLLMILDNCEHLLSGAARLAEEVLGTASGVRLLATSREPLGIRGERVLGVPSLQVPVDDGDFGAVGDADAVKLFVDRAHAARSGFSLTPDNSAAVAQLCRRLDGIPLAIELAAARVRSMAPGDIAARLDQRFRLLTGSAHSAVNRHQTLRAAIDWSYDLLDEDERELLGRLWVCAGGFDLAAAEAIGSGGTLDAIEVDQVLSRLVDKSLVTAEERGDSMRYRMFETIRAYASERIDDAQRAEAIRRRHADHYAAFASEASKGLKGPAELFWLHRTEEELDNLRAVVAWSLDSDDPSAAVSVVFSLAINGLRLEAVVASWAAAVVASPTAREDARYPAVLAFCAWIKQREGDSEEAERLAETAAALIEDERCDPLLVSRVLASTSGVDGYSGRNPHRRALRWAAAATSTGDIYYQALAFAMISVGEMSNGNPSSASAERGLDLARTSGSPSAISYCAFTAALSLLVEDPTRAASLLEESIRCADAAENNIARTVATGVRAGLLSQAGEHVAAATEYRDYAARALEQGHRSAQALAFWCLAGCLVMLGHDDAACTIVGWAESITGTSVNPTSAVLQGLNPDAIAALFALREKIGTERYAKLAAMGAAMSDDEVLPYVDRHLSQLADELSV